MGALPDNTIYYAESMQPISPLLMSLYGSDIRAPGFFNANFPTIAGQIVGYFEAIHAMHDRASTILASAQPYCLFLRTFSLAGAFGNLQAGETGVTRYLMMTRGDTDTQDALSAMLGDVPLISCLNLLDLMTIGREQQGASKLNVLRLLSHNWRQCAATLIDGAHCIVLARSPGFFGGGESTDYEMGLIHKLDQQRRTLCLVDSNREQVEEIPGTDFYRAIAAPRLSQTIASVDLVRDSLAALAQSSSKRIRQLPVMPTPRCFVLDKGYEPKQMTEFGVTEDNYGSSFPLDFETNLNLLNPKIPRIEQAWREVELRLNASAEYSPKLVEVILQDALACLALAASLERYVPMAQSLFIIGCAHHVLSGSKDIALLCIDGATKLASRVGRADLIGSYQGMRRYLTGGEGP